MRINKKQTQCYQNRNMMQNGMEVLNAAAAAANAAAAAAPPVAPAEASLINFD